jgi:5'(3')-deoxyribonucleotidase
MRIFLDLDGVIVDYVPGIAAFFGMPVDELYGKWPPGVYEICHALGKGKDVWAEVWDAPETTWSEMPEFPWSRTLFEKCNETAETFILTSPINSGTCVSGKVKWIHSFAGRDYRKYILTHFKYNCARWDHVLIDDREYNVGLWEKEGGEGILFPSHGNRLYQMKADPMSYLLPELDRVTSKIRRREQLICTGTGTSGSQQSRI